MDLAPLQLQEIEGWMEPEELQWLCNIATGKQRVIEIGAFQGRSSCAFLAGLGDKGQLVVVDTFDGRGTVRHEEFKSMAGQTALFEKFLANVNARRLHVPMILRGDSGDKMVAASISDDTADLLFIDGSHDEASVRRDLEAWVPKVYDNGIICGHDYHPTWPSVVSAVDAWAAETHRRISHSFCGGLWMTTK